jgi:TRAP-type transport system periplasmic protein
MTPMNIPSKRISRRHVLAAAAGVSAATILHWPANAAEFTYKCGASTPPTTPSVAASIKAADRIKEATNGRLEITVYPNEALGSDPAGISQTISGAVQMWLTVFDFLASRNPAMGITGTGFAFPDYDRVWAAMDGDLGKMLRAMAEQIGIYALDTCVDDGFRQVTTRNKPIVTPDDLHGFKIRLPNTPLLVSLFSHLRASPTIITFSEVYSALQTGLADGCEQALVTFDAAKLNEVCKYGSLTNHAWIGRHLGFNIAAWKKLPPDIQEIVHREWTAAAIAERQESMALDTKEEGMLTAKGMTFNTPDNKLFREALAKSGFYGDIKKSAGDQPWAVLEKYVGTLA